MRLAVVDVGHADDYTARPAFWASRIRLQVVKRPHKETKGFIVLPKRRIAERGFGWFNCARRLAKDFEASIECAHA